MKTAAIYARVSSDRQKEEQTIASQTSALRAHAAEHAYIVPDGYVCATVVLIATGCNENRIVQRAGFNALFVAPPRSGEA